MVLRKLKSAFIYAGVLSCGSVDITEWTPRDGEAAPASLPAADAGGSSSENARPSTPPSTDPAPVAAPSGSTPSSAGAPSSPLEDAGAGGDIAPAPDTPAGASTNGPDASTITGPACERGELACRGSLIARCNARGTGFELLRDCRDVGLCEQAAERCAFGACPAEELGCSLGELSPPGEGVHGVGLGRTTTCAVIAAGGVRCWGRNQRGQLGYGHTRNIGDLALPVTAGDVDVGGAVAQVVAGVFHTCALFTNGEVSCWGRASSGRLGSGDFQSRRYFEELGGPTTDVGDDETPASVGRLSLGGPAIQLAAGDNFTCALLLGGDVRCWGDGAFGVLGGAGTEDIGDDEEPGSMAPLDLGEPAAFIAAGDLHACAILRSGEVRCWGRAAGGRLGYGNDEDVGDDETPASAGSVELHEQAVRLSAGGAHTCAVLRSGKLQCWGDGTTLALGHDTGEVVGDDELPSARPAIDLGAPVTEVAAGDGYTCALLDGGAVRCWGVNRHGELGAAREGTWPLSAAASRVDLGEDAVSIEAYRDHTCAVLATRELVCWGSGLNGNLGYGNAEDVGDDETPASVGAVIVLRLPPDPVPPTEPAQDAGVLPVDPPPARPDAGVPEPAACETSSCDHRIDDMALGDQHTCVLTASGTVRCWGDNQFGQLGYGHIRNIGLNDTAAAAGEVDLGARALQIVAGENHTCALLEGGGVRCWGQGNAGQLGLANQENVGDDEHPASAPTIDLGSPARSLAAGGGDFSCALLEDGNVRCWGAGTRGQLGVGSLISDDNRNIGDDETPATVGPIELGVRVVALATGQNHSCALSEAGTVRCWGTGSGGRLGYSNTSNIGDDETPASAGDVPLGGAAIQLSLGNAHSCAVLVGGAVRCWGSQLQRALGQRDVSFGTNVGDDEAPDAAPALDLGQPAVWVAAGGQHTCVLLSDASVRCWGGNRLGQLGNARSDVSLDASSAVERLSLGGAVVALGGGDTHTCAVLATRELSCWGDASNGKLGYGGGIVNARIGDDETPASMGPVPLF